MSEDELTPHPLAHVRKLRGWSLADVAKIVASRSGLNMASWRQKVNRWERRGVTPEPAAQHALADALNVPQTLVDRIGWPAWLLTVDTPEPIDAPWTPGSTREILHSVTETASLDRRGFLVMSGQVLATTASASLASLPAPVQSGLDGGRVGGEMVKALRQRIEQLWHVDDRLGGGACLPAIHADLRLIDTVLRTASFTHATERALYSVAASAFRFAGFAAFDAGLNAAAQRFWHAGLRAAHTAEDRSEAVYILSNIALQDIYVNTGRDALDLIDAARRNVDPACKTVLSMLDCWQARAHATRDERHEAATMLNLADDRWSNRKPEDDPEWIYWMPQPSLTAEAGTALNDIGQHHTAEDLLTLGMRGLPEDAHREHNLYLIRIAEAQLASGRLDQAVQTTQCAIEAAAMVSSSRAPNQTRRLLRHISSLGQVFMFEPQTEA